MSNYFDNKPSFMEAKVEQHNNHFVMSKPMQELKTHYISLDTKFRDEYNTKPAVNYNITIPERINRVQSISAVCVDLPLTIYNISAALENNTFTLQYTTASATTTQVITIPDGQYTNDTITTAINGLFTGLSLPIVFSVFNTYFSRFTFTPSTTVHSATIQFAVDTAGNFNKYNVKSRLGWMLGFRVPSAVFSTSYPDTTASTLTGTGMLQLNAMQYIYLVVDEFNNNSHQTSFQSYLPQSVINRNILARISINHLQGFGTVENANLYNGLLISDVRTYSNEKVDIQKINVQLVNEYGNVISLNNQDFSFCLKLQLN